VVGSCGVHPIRSASSSTVATRNPPSRWSCRRALGADL